MAIMHKNDFFSSSKVANERIHTPLHFHTDYELCYVQAGEFRFVLNEKILDLTPGDAVIVPKNAIHNTDSGDCLYNYLITLSFDNHHLFYETSTMLSELCAENIVHIPTDKKGEVEELLYKIEDEYIKKRDSHQTLIKFYIGELLTMLYRYRLSRTENPSHSMSIIQKIVDYITLNFDRDITLNTLCKKYNISSSYLSHKFKNTMGCSISEYITSVRIANAEKLLKSGKISITEVSAKCGFNDSNYFARVFKQHKGITPYKFLKNNME
ncbi:MAG: helix-turn-helix domain-containing protein [Clostridia bacterium]|nr:helix-turn-helix domain-containing protein [Clostridia bacterium]